MAVNLTLKHVIAAIILVVMALVVIMVFVAPISEAMEKFEEKTEVIEPQPPGEEETIYQSAAYITMSDTKSEKIAKLFRYFDANYAGVTEITSKSADTVISTKLFSKFVIADEDRLTDSDILKINEKFLEWNASRADYNIKCAYGLVPEGRVSIGANDVCWIDGLEECKIYHNGYTLMSGRLTMRVYWRDELNINTGVHNIYPIVTVCSDKP